jgi:DNA-binding response OmpR family regulator
MRTEGVTTPVVMLTGRGDEAIAFSAAKLGADYYVTKPFRPRDLVQALLDILARQQTQPLPGRPEESHVSRRDGYLR